ncbi:probable UDP-glucosyl transferase 73B6 [Arachis stenosperma]|uniref:probable UDP-glucosyl transferase 73B6 n=1 Tax=Arachis stenosperma TaxID=217475 RepID=UPI0025AD5C66|nr:probable UDP-glucosyl transferase 73B6 [Arachis stenosperma]
MESHSPYLDEQRQQPLRIYFIPFLAAGHILPLSDIARVFTARGHHVTIITTPSNAQIIRTSTPHHPNFLLHTVPFPSQELGLPDGIENLSDTFDDDTFMKVFNGMDTLREPIEHFLGRHPPDCIVADFMFPWVEDLANKLRVPRLVFNGFSLFAICAVESFRAHPVPPDASPPFLIHDFPHSVTMNATPPTLLREVLESMFEAELRSHGIILNNFVELDGEEYVQYYERTTGHKVWHLGPACLLHGTAEEKAERGQKSVLSVQKCMSWLDSKNPNSVVYICFGSLCCFPDCQLYEIACAVEASGCEFIWVVREKEGKEEEEEMKEKWLPKGFEERNSKKGLIIRGWAPQVLILRHSAVGGFLSHCGWNSTVEAISAGVPMITWPMHSEQFYNEKLITEVRGVGVEVGVDEWRSTGYGQREKVVGRGRIEVAIRRLMDGGNEAQEIRVRAQELGKKARAAVQEGGSSFNNFTALIDELKRLRDCKHVD